MNRFNQFSRGFFFLFITLVATQCSVFELPNSTLQDEGGIASGGTSGTDGTSGGTGGTTDEGDGKWWIVTNEQGCTSVRAPTKDDRPDTAYEAESIAPIYLAMSRVSLGANKDDEASTPDPEAWREYGFDRDGRCTQSPTCCVDPNKCGGENDKRVNERSCLTNPGGVPGGVATEGNFCIDNAMGSLFSIGFSLALTVPDSPFNQLGMNPEDWNCELHRGGFSMIFKISDYNGTENDPFVRLDMYVSTGLQELDLAFKCREDRHSPLLENWYAQQRWLPSKHWKIARRSISLSSQSINNELPDSTTFDSTAFVRNGYLFAALPDGQEFTFAGDNTLTPGFRNIMYNPILLAKLFVDQNINTWTMQDAVLSFYILSSDFLRSFREVGFCENMCGVPESLKGLADLSQDVLLSGETLPDVACDALSLATKFRAYQVTATADDIVDIIEPEECPPLRNPDMPQYGCVCVGTTCVPPEGGIPDSGIPESGTLDSGTPEDGTLDSGTPEDGTLDSGTPEGGKKDGGTPDSAR